MRSIRGSGLRCRYLGKLDRSDEAQKCWVGMRWAPPRDAASPSILVRLRRLQTRRTIKKQTLKARINELQSKTRLIREAIANRLATAQLFIAKVRGLAKPDEPGDSGRRPKACGPMRSPSTPMYWIRKLETSCWYKGYQGADRRSSGKGSGRDRDN